ncbi:amidohydrolase family protein [Streptomyces xiamenensis]|uniref:amidohydrolase family protein n=1 Tax=Streptomyces xiamenensis TaxID=408015 RepID=UPI0035E35FBD
MHAHVSVPAVDTLTAGHPGMRAFMEAARQIQGPESVKVSLEMVTGVMPSMTDAEQRLAHMDASRVDVQVISVNPMQYHSWAPLALAREVVEATHEGITEHRAQCPERLTGLGVIPLQHPELTVWALEDAVLKHGFAGVELPTHAHGVDFSDERLTPLWKRAEELEALLFVHPMGTTVGERLGKWNLHNTVGQPFEHAIALSHLIFGGVLDRHPKLRLLFPHGGGYLPGYLGRSDHAWTVRPDARGCRKTPSAYLQDVYFDSLVHTADPLHTLIRAAGSSRVLLGTDFPFDMGQPHPVDWLGSTGLAPEAREEILEKNAESLGLVPGAQRKGQS